MSKIKTIYIILGLIVFVALGVMVIIPEVIPSWVAVQQIIILVLYVANIVFVYVILARLWNYLKQNFERSTSVLVSTLTAIMVSGGLFFSFIFTSLGIGQGFMGGSLAKELNYPSYKVKLYLYDDSFLDAMTTLKIKHKTLPIMQDLAFIDNCQPLELKIMKSNDTVNISCNNVVIKVDLTNRNAEKTYLKPNTIE